MQVEIPLGDVVDKVTILDIKARRLTDPAALRNVAREAETLRKTWRESGHPPLNELPQWDELSATNRQLWDVEDALRECESRQEFGETFVSLARDVYRLNDQRAALKRSINLDLGSDLVEEKSYGKAAP